MAEQVYRYKAFISYRHVERDRKWARWLIEGLETFRTPRALLAQGVPSHIGHLFRDDDEIPASSNLSGQIEEALQASQYLIVVCSPDTPQSMWVRHEIDYFRKLGRGDRILALLVEGEPSEAFPPELLQVPYEVTAPDGSKRIELRDEEPIAADIRRRSDEPQRATERRALLRVSATLLGCSFDDLAQRDHRRLVHRRRIVGSAIAAALLLVAALGGWWWDYTRLKTAYFADYGTHWAEPFGIGRLSAATASRRYVSYEIESRRGRVVAMRRVNGSGGLRALKGDEIDSDPWNSGVAEWRIRYQGDRVGTIELFGATGRLLRTETWRFFEDGASGLVAFTQAKGIATTLSSKVSSFQTRVGASLSERRPDVTQHRLAFTPDGLIARRSFETVWGTAARDENGSAGRAYDYSAAGQVTALRNLDVHGAVLVSKSGVAEERRAYAPGGDLERYELRDRRGAVLYAVAVRSDAFGNRVERLWTGAGGRPLLNDEDGVARETDAYDDRGNLARVRFFDENLQPAPGKFGFAQLTYEYDAKGRITRTNYLDALGAPVLGTLGIAGVTVGMDAAGNVVAINLFGLDGKPKLGSEGFAVQRTRFDDNGMPLETSWFGTDGKPIAKPDGVAVIKGVYDGRGNAVAESYFNAAGRPVMGDQYARIARQFDERGNEVAESYFGIDGKPVANRQGAMREAFAYTDAGTWSQIDFLDADGRPLLNKDGVARMTFAYDAKGNAVQETFFGTAGQRVVDAGGYSRLAQVYDAFDNMIEQHYFDAADQPARNANGYASLLARYDQRGNDLEDTFLGADGKPVLTVKGYARTMRVYDAANRVVEQHYYDAEGRPTGGAAGIAMFKFAYDARGRQVDFATYGADGKLFVSALGYARGRDVYDARGNKIESAFFGADGKLIVIASGYAIVRDAFDARGNKTDEAYFGADGAPMLHRGKYARVHLVYRNDGSLAAIAAFDVLGKPVKL